MYRLLIDDAGRQVALARPPRRIVSLVPSISELLCALGCADRLVGVTRYCTEPATALRSIARVGGTKNPDLLAITRCAPELVIMNAEENRDADFQALVGAGITVWVSYPRTVRQAVESIRRLGTVLETEAAAQAIVGTIREALAVPAAAGVRVFCPIWRKPWMSFNSDTYASDVLLVSGGLNVCAGAERRYPVVDLDTIARADPEVILLPDEPYPFAAGHRATLDPLEGTAAMRADRVHLVDGKALSWYGPRTAHGIGLFRRLLAP
jgi:ABC-type Fe3+-hydroxamate transport system substrate-binding protein